MAGFLRKKAKQDPRTKPGLPSVSPPSSPSSPTPLFARFATAQSQGPPRIVSQPMMLSGVRRDIPQAIPARGGREAALPLQRDVETRPQRNVMEEQGRHMPAEQGNNAPLLRQHSPTQVRVRPQSRVLMLDKPLPPSLEFGPALDSASSPTPPPQLRSTGHPSPIQGEYAHLWSIIAAGDKQLPEIADSPATSPVYGPIEVDDVEQPLRPTNTITTPSSDRFGPSTGLSNSRAAGAQNLVSSPIVTSIDQTIAFTQPGGDLRAQTLTPPSEHSLSQQRSFTDTSALLYHSGASSSRTTLSSDIIRNGTAPNDLSRGPQVPAKPSYNFISNGFLNSSVVSFDQLSDATSITNVKANTNRKLSKPKPGAGQPLQARPSAARLSSSAPQGENRITPPSQPGRGATIPGAPTSYRALPTETAMGVNYNQRRASAVPSSFKDIPTQGILPPNNHQRDAGPNAYMNPQQQQRASVSYTSTTTSPQRIPPRKASSMRVGQNSLVAGRPLIFSAMATIDQEAAQAVSPTSQQPQGLPTQTINKIRPVSTVPIHQQYPPPSASSVPLQRGVSLYTQATPPRNQVRPPSATIPNPNTFMPAGAPLPSFPHQSHQQPGPLTPPFPHHNGSPAPTIPYQNNQHSGPPIHPPSFPHHYSNPPQTIPSQNQNQTNGFPPPRQPPTVDAIPINQSPPRARRPSTSRPGQNSVDMSVTPSQVQGQTSPPQHQRTPVKTRPTTPTPIQKGVKVDMDVLGVPLDDDPFAKVEGVKLLKPSSASRPPSPTGTDSTGRRHKSRDERESREEEIRWESGQMNALSSSNVELPRPGSSSVSLNIYSNGNGHIAMPPSPVSPDMFKKMEHPRRGRAFFQQQPGEGSSVELRSQLGMGMLVPPPIIAATQEDPDQFTPFLSEPKLFRVLVSFLSFYDWCMILSVSREIRFMVVQNPGLREEVLERFLKTVGYKRWMWGNTEREPLSLSLQDLNDYMRGVSTPTHEYARVAALYVHSLSIHPSHRDQSLYDTVSHLAASTRAYTRVVLRLRAQAEKEVAMARSRVVGRSGSRPASRAPSPTFSQSNHSHTSVHTQQTRSVATTMATATTFQSPLFRLKRAPLLRVFVPSPEGDWLSDKSVLECEAECRKAGVTGLMRMGDVVWDVAVGDEGNVGRLVWDGSYLIDLDYTYSEIGDLPKYMPTLMFPPSYFHRVIRTGPNASNPIIHIDIQPWGEEIAINLQLLQDRVRTETPQGAHHNVVRWVHRSSFVIRPPARGAVRSPPGQYGPSAPPTSFSAPPRIPIPDTSFFVDPGWYGTIVVETEGTNECLADLQDRCGPGVFPPRPTRANGQKPIDREGKLVYRILREKSRPGEIWIRTVSAKERLL